MKRIFLLVMIIWLTPSLRAQQALTKDQEQVQQTVVKMFDALSNRDSIKLKNYCTTDITLYEYGQIWNMDTLIHKAISMNTAVDFQRTNTFEFIRTETDKNIAWVTYKLSSVFIKNGKQTTIQWLETVLLNKQKGQWKIKNLHSTLLNKN
ncbi:MAG: nuclear transport factor 2 family protein [Chitinophagaceae bacterium]|nr:nuclear transport factor 2 family protein [Chitinophagaceae bacterium]